MRNQEDILKLEECYRVIKDMRYLCEREMSFYLDVPTLNDIYHTCESIYSTLHVYMKGEDLSHDPGIVMDHIKTMNVLIDNTMSYIEINPFTDDFRIYVTELCNMCANYCSLYVSEGSTRFEKHTKPLFEEVTYKCRDLISILDLHVSAEVLLAKTKKLVMDAEETLQSLGFGDTLLSVSEHYIKELKKEIKRKPLSCDRELHRPPESQQENKENNNDGE